MVWFTKESFRSFVEEMQCFRCGLNRRSGISSIAVMLLMDLSPSKDFCGLSDSMFDAALNELRNHSDSCRIFSSDMQSDSVSVFEQIIPDGSLMQEQEATSVMELSDPNMSNFVNQLSYTQSDTDCASELINLGENTNQSLEQAASSDMELTDNENIDEFVSSENQMSNALNRGRFMLAEELFAKIMRTNTCDCMSVIPNHCKENVFFTMTRDSKSNYVDDCGVWLKPSLETSEFVIDENGNLLSISKKNGFYCRYARNTLTQLEPQPVTGDILTLKDTTQNLKRIQNINVESVGSKASPI